MDTGLSNDLTTVHEWLAIIKANNPNPPKIVPTPAPASATVSQISYPSRKHFTKRRSNTDY